jgi:peptidoglycan/LPS O-acetylase OafA/YrhL
MRIKSIDFLRGIAILLVLCRHFNYSATAHLIGWSGVDLFFVLSGFLVSGLLFNEYKKNNSVQPFKFLIRRGFKIYPLFWFAILLVVIAHYFTGYGTSNSELLAELFFYQNYKISEILRVTWSLAVEEHFYILLIISVTIAIKCKKLENKKAFHTFAFIVLAYCLCARIITSIQYSSYDMFTHYTPTHLRIDALTFGCIIAYNYHFNKEWLSSFINKNVEKLSFIMLACLLPLFFFGSETIFMRTIGFTMTYVGFGIMLNLFVVADKVSASMEKYVGSIVYNGIAKIGLYSYAIYLLHIQVLILLWKITGAFKIAYLTDTTFFIAYVCLSVFVGMFFTYLIENPMLKLREKFFPARKKDDKKVIFPTIQTA